MKKIQPTLSFSKETYQTEFYYEKRYKFFWPEIELSRIVPNMPAGTLMYLHFDYKEWLQIHTYWLSEPFDTSKAELIEKQTFSKKGHQVTVEGNWEKILYGMKSAFDFGNKYYIGNEYKTDAK
jgi:hypothetical protein